MLILENYSFWRTTRYCFKATPIFNLHKSLPNDLISICKIFVDDTTIFTKVFDKDKSQKDLSQIFIVLLI